MGKPAVFLDRDKTIIKDPGYINDPDMISLLPGAAEAIRLLNEAGFVTIVVSNQSGVARGLVTEEQLAEIHERLREILLEQGARLDAIYYCPYLDSPEATVDRYRRASDLRKPAPGMLVQAAHELEIDLAESWMVGDRTRDVVAGKRAGCRTILIDANGRESTHEDDTPDFAVPSLLGAARLVVSHPKRPAEERPMVVEELTADTPEEDVLSAPQNRNRQNTEDTHELLREIRDLLRRQERRGRQEDFSVMRLMATVAQMLALVAALWGLMIVFRNSTASIPRFGLACFLQLLTLTALLSSKRR